MGNPAVIQQTGVGRSTIWVPDWFDNPFQIGIGTVVVGTATYNIEHCFEPVDQLVLKSPWPVASGAKLAFPQVPLQWMAIGRPVVDLTTAAAIAGGTTVAAFDASTVTLSGAVAGGGVLAGDLISFLSWQINGGFSGATANAQGNYAFPVRGISINLTAGSGTVICELTQAMTPP